MRNDIQILTCIDDARSTGGGVSDVANTLHLEFLKAGVKSLICCRIMAEGAADSDATVGTKFSDCFSSPYAENNKLLVHVHGLWTLFLLRSARFALRKNLPLIVSPHGMLEDWARNHKLLRKKIAWWLYQKKIVMKADLLIVNSSRELATVRRLGLKNPVGLIENGVEFDGVLSQKRDDSTAQENKRVLFLSRLSPVKGLPDLIQAWLMLPSAHGYELRIYGNADPGYEKKIEKLIEKYNVASSVRLMGPVFGDEKWRVYQTASFFVLPSYSENFGIVIAEALLAGLPVITTRNTPWECLEREGLGLQVDNDPKQLSEAIFRMMAMTEQERSRLGANAQRYVNEHFHWPKIADKYLCTYNWVLNPSAKCPEWIDFSE